MPRILDRRETFVGVAYHQVMLCDDETAESRPPSPSSIGHEWLSVGNSIILLTSRGDIGYARFLLEAWDGEPPLPGESEWPAVEEVALYLPSGQINVRQLAQGQINNVLNAGGPGAYRVRLAWREAEEPDLENGEPEAFLLAQFWRQGSPGQRE